MLITISGMDCSGKSTQISLLELALTDRPGTRSIRTIWHRPGYSGELDAIRRLVRKILPRALPPAGPGPAREAKFSRPMIGQGWFALAACDLAYHYGVKLRWYSLRHTHVICDRFVWDAVIDLQLRFPEFASHARGVGRVLMTLAPRPDVSFLLVVSKPVLEERAAAKKEPFPDSPSVRDSRFRAYQRLTRQECFVVVASEGSPSDVHTTLVDFLRDRRSASV